MKPIILTLILMISVVNADTNIQITAQVDGKSTALNNSETGHVMGNVLGYLSTCIRYENVVGKPYELQSSLKALEKIKSGNHLFTSLSSKGLVLPLRKENIAVDEIYIGFSDNHLPNLYTISDGKPQGYAKCIGDLSLKNFKCDDLMAKLFNFDQQHPHCNRQNTKKNEKYNLTIKASLSTAGPYGDFWQVEIKEFADLSGGIAKFSKSARMATGEFKGEKIIDKENFIQLHSIINAQSFNALSQSISSKIVQFHKPRFVLEICKEGSCHKVELYDPESLKQSTGKKRFIKMWQAIMKVLPEWPSQWPGFLNPENKQGK